MDEKREVIEQVEEVTQNKKGKKKLTVKRFFEKLFLAFLFVLLFAVLGLFAYAKLLPDTMRNNLKVFYLEKTKETTLYEDATKDAFVEGNVVGEFRISPNGMPRLIVYKYSDTSGNEVFLRIAAVFYSEQYGEHLVNIYNLEKNTYTTRRINNPDELFDTAEFDPSIFNITPSGVEDSSTENRLDFGIGTINYEGSIDTSTQYYYETYKDVNGEEITYYFTGDPFHKYSQMEIIAYVMNDELCYYHLKTIESYANNNLAWEVKDFYQDHSELIDNINNK